jgi:RNA polymerase sigma factor (sigma-70 family)
VRTILQRISDGDGTAIDACLREYGDLVWRLASRYLDRAPGEIEDAVQEVFVELWLHAGRFDPALGGEATFVATLAHRRLTDYQRRVTVRRRLVRSSEDATESGVSPGVLPSAGIRVRRGGGPPRRSRRWTGCPRTRSTPWACGSTGG